MQILKGSRILKSSKSRNSKTTCSATQCLIIELCLLFPLIIPRRSANKQP